MGTALASIDPTKTVDHYDLDDGDASHPIYIDYIIPADFKGLIYAKLSWKARFFRSTAALNPSSVGAGAAHHHNVPITSGTVGMAVTVNNLGVGDLQASGGGNPATTDESTHTHSLTGSTTQQVTESTSVSSISAIAIDGRDVTALLAGPWTGDVVELNLSALFPVSGSVWHTIALTPAGLGRFVSLLRLAYTS